MIHPFHSQMPLTGLMELLTYFDGYVGGDEANDVVTDPSISSPIIDIIDNYIAHFVTR